jgi:hypothetical protein
MLRLTKKPRLNLTKSAGDWGERVHKIEDWRDRWSPSQSLFFHYSLSPNSPSLPPSLPIYLELSLAQFSSKLSKKKIELLIVVYTLSLSRI